MIHGQLITKEVRKEHKDSLPDWMLSFIYLSYKQECCNHGRVSIQNYHLTLQFLSTPQSIWLSFSTLFWLSGQQLHFLGFSLPVLIIWAVFSKEILSKTIVLKTCLVWIYSLRPLEHQSHKRTTGQLCKLSFPVQIAPWSPQSFFDPWSS